MSIEVQPQTRTEDVREPRRPRASGPVDAAGHLRLKEAGVSIVVPAHNEEAAIGDVLRSLTEMTAPLEVPCEIIVVDDGSQDRTASVAASLGARLISHETNRGYGAALKSGVLEAKHDVIVITDGDGTYPSDAIPKLLAHIEGCDMVVASRTGDHVQIPPLRKPAKWILTLLANYLSGQKIPDLNSGLRAIRKRSLFPFWSVLPNGFSFTSTISLGMLTNGYRVVYIPIDYAKRQGKSKIRPVQDTLNFLQLIIRTVLYFDPLKIFVPFSGIFFLASLGLFMYRVLFARAFGLTIVVLFVTGVQLLALGMIADLINKRLR